MKTKDQRTILYDSKLNRKITENSDGSIDAKSHGNNIRMEADGTTNMTLEKLTRVEIYNIFELRHYNISIIDGVTKHEFEFLDGATGIISYILDGKLLEYSLKGGAAQVITPDGVITVGMRSGGLTTVPDIDEMKELAEQHMQSRKPVTPQN